MKKSTKVIVIAAVALAVLSAAAVGVVALTNRTPSTEAKAKPAGMKLPKVWGYVTGAKFAQLDVNANQVSTDAATIVIKRVLAPADAWIVVHLDDNGMPGDRVGLKHISKGESTDVEVALDGVTSDKVIVAIHADKGTADKFDFDMMKKLESADRPFFVDNKELASVVTVREFGVKAEFGAASIEVSDQPGATSSIVVDRAVAPGPAWIVVHLNDDGMPGARVGFAPIPAGDSAGVSVALDSQVPLGDSLLVAVHADRGVLGTLEFNMDDKFNSPDQPFFVSGKEVATKVLIK